MNEWLKKIEIALKNYSKSKDLENIISSTAEFLHAIKIAIQKKYILLLPELLPDSCPKFTYFTIKAEKARELLISNSCFIDLDPSEKDFCLLSVPGIACYLLNKLALLERIPIDFDELLYGLQKEFLLSLKTMVFMLKETEIPFGIFITTPECEPETEEWEKVKAVSTIFYLENGLILYLINGNYVRKYPEKFISTFKEDKSLIHTFMYLTNAHPFSPEDLKLFLVMDSPLSRKIPPKRILYPNIPATKIGMKQLKASFVMLEDLREGDKVEDEDEKKLIWSSLKNKRPFNSPAIRKNDILVPIKRKNNFNVAIICDKIPEPNKEVFVAKSDIAVVRIDPKVLSDKELENFAKLLMAEFRSFPQKGLSVRKTLNINILRNIIGELISNETFKEILKETDLEKLMSKGRRIVRIKFAKYLGAHSFKA